MWSWKSVGVKSWRSVGDKGSGVWKRLVGGGEVDFEVGHVVKVEDGLSIRIGCGDKDLGRRNVGIGHTELGLAALAKPSVVIQTQTMLGAFLGGVAMLAGDGLAVDTEEGGGWNLLDFALIADRMPTINTMFVVRVGGHRG